MKDGQRVMRQPPTAACIPAPRMHGTRSHCGPRWNLSPCQWVPRLPALRSIQLLKLCSTFKGKPARNTVQARYSCTLGQRGGEHPSNCLSLVHHCQGSVQGFHPQESPNSSGPGTGLLSCTYVCTHQNN